MRQRHDKDKSESQECITVDNCFGLFSLRQCSIIPQRTECEVDASQLFKLRFNLSFNWWPHQSFVPSQSPSINKNNLRYCNSFRKIVQLIIKFFLFLIRLIGMERGLNKEDISFSKHLTLLFLFATLFPHSQYSNFATITHL